MPETDPLFFLPAAPIVTATAGWVLRHAIRRCEAVIRKAAANAMFGVGEVRATLASRA